MALTYTWKVTGLKKTEDGTVVQTYWQKIGSDGTNEGTFSGATPFSGDPATAGFVPFEQLTEEVVLGWIQSVVVGDYEEHVNKQIQKQIDAKAVTEATMPWAPVVETLSLLC